MALFSVTIFLEILNFGTMRMKIPQILKEKSKKNMNRYLVATQHNTKDTHLCMIDAYTTAWQNTSDSNEEDRKTSTKLLKRGNEIEKFTNMESIFRQKYL